MNQSAKTAFRDRLATFIESQVGLSIPEQGKSPGRAETDTDVVVVGSSIVHMTRALTLAALGMRVIVMEQRHSLGGVWSTISTLGLEFVERAPHIFMPIPRAYALIEDVFETRLSEMSPQPVTLELNEDSEVILQDPFPRSPETAHPQVVYEGLCKHPALGTNALIEKLFALGHALGIQYLSGTHVHSLHISEDRTATVISNSHKVRARHVVLSRGSPIVQIHRSQSQIVPFRSSTNVSLHFLVKTKRANSFSFVHVDGHPLIKEIHDITGCTGGIELGQKLIIIKLRYNIFESGRLPILDARLIFEDLKRIDVLDKGDILINSATTGYAQTRLLETCVVELKRNYNDVIEIVPFAALNEDGEGADLCAQDMSVALSAPEFYEGLVSQPGGKQ